MFVILSSGIGPRRTALRDLGQTVYKNILEFPGNEKADLIVIIDEWEFQS